MIAVAAVALHEQVLVLRQQLRDPIGLAQSLVNLGKAVQQTGDLARARALLEDGLARLRRLGIERDIGACLYNLALVARAEGETAEAAQFAGESLAIKHAAGEWFDVAQCLELLAGAGRRSRPRAAGGAPARRGVGPAPQHRRPPEHRRARRQRDLRDGPRRRGSGRSRRRHRRRRGVDARARAIAEATEIALVSPSGAPLVARPRRPSSVADTPAARRLGLTAREIEVLGYLVQRYTDREIAGALTISLRTVTTHVGRILTKLGVDGRRQAATEAARLGLLAS